MSTFRLYLWKEWREQRAALVALGVMLPLLVATIGLQIPRARAASSAFVFVVAAVALLVGLIAIGGELLGADRRRAGTWLERLPRGYAPPFLAKLLAFAGSSAAVLAFGALVGLLIALLRAHSVQEVLRIDGSLADQLLPLLAVVVIGPWVFSASAWSRHGMLAVAAGALLGGALGLPLLAWGFVGYESRIVELVLGSALHVSGALASAWVGFRAQRLGRGLAGVALRGGGSAVLLLAPLWIWSLAQLEACKVDLRSKDCFLEETWVSEDGKVALVVASMRTPRWEGRPPNRAFRIDLERGVAVDLGVEGAYLQSLSFTGGSEGLPGFSLIVVRSEEDDLAFDVRSGMPASDPVRISSRISVEAAGHGVWYYEDNERVYHDPYRDFDMPLSEVGLSWGYDALIGPDVWLIHGPEWLEFDPLADELSPAEWLNNAWFPITLLADGRLLAMGDRGPVLADPATNELVPVEGPLERLELGYEALQARDELLLRGDSGWYRFEIACRELIPLPLERGRWPVRRLADGDLVLASDLGFERWHAEDGSCTTILAFEDLRLKEALP